VAFHVFYLLLLHHYVKAKDCSPYTHIIPCSRLCCVTNEHDHGALVLDKVNSSVLVYVVQSSTVELSSEGYSCKLSPKTKDVGSNLTSDSTLHAEMANRVAGASSAFVRLHKVKVCTRKFCPCQLSCNFPILSCHFCHMVVKLGHCLPSTLACCWFSHAMHETNLRHLATRPVVRMSRTCMPAGQFVNPDSWMLVQSLL